VIRTFARLKWRLVRNGLVRSRRGGLVMVGFVLALLWAIGIAIALAVSARTATSDADLRRIGIEATCAWFAFWTFGPLIVGVDETVDTQRLALLPLTRRDLRTGLLTSALVGVGPLCGAILAIGLIVGFTPGNAGGALLVVLGVATAFTLGLGASRALAAQLARAQRSRRGRDVSVLAAAIAGASLWLGAQIVGGLSTSASRRLVSVLRWTPPGIAGQAIVDARDGALFHAVAGVAAAVACVAVLAWLWFSGVRALLVDTGSADARSATGEYRADASAWLRGGETRASLRKELRALVRSPARRTATIVAVVFGTGFLVLQTFRAGTTPPPAMVLLAPAAAFFAISAIDNQLGYDSASLWLEVACAAPRRAQILARGASWLPALVVPSIPAAILLAARSGGWRYVPVAVLLAALASGVPLGVGAVVSTIAPIPIPISPTRSPIGRRTPAAGASPGSSRSARCSPTSCC
jgi:hypothetical protein